MPQRVTIEVADHVAVVTLNRPDKHNALDGAMFEGIVEAAGQVAQMPQVRAVVLHGAGPSFCSGLDVSAFGSLDMILDRPAGQRSNLAQRTCTDWIDVPAPVIAAVHGNCFGGGLQIALGAAKGLAAEIASRSPDATRAAKRLYDSSWHGPVEDGLLLETELQTGLIGSPNQIEAVRAGMAKEPANFADGRVGTGSVA